MAKRIDTLANELKAMVKSGKAIIGTSRTLKLLRSQGLQKVFLSSNCPAEMEEEINRILGTAELVKLPYPNDELGSICKKEFSISVLGLSK
jgi:ribosomal protein L30E